MSYPGAPSVPDVQKTTVGVSRTKLPVGSMLEISITLRGSHGNPIVQPQALSTLDLVMETPGGQTANLVVPNQLSASGICVTRVSLKDIGHHKIHVKVCGSDVKHSPVSVLVWVRGNLVKTFKPRMHNPHDVIKHENIFVVTDKDSNQVQVFDSNFRPVNKFTSPQKLMQGSGKFDPYGIAWTGKTFVVTDLANHCVVEFSNFVPTQVFGQETLHQPCGIAVARNGDVYVSDCFKHCIFVFNQQRHCTEILGGLGSALGQMNTPWFIAMNSQQHLVVAEFKNHRIQVWNTHNNKALRIIDVKHNGKSWDCRGLAVDHHDNIYVTVRNGFMRGISVETVLVYSPTGEFLGNFGEGFNYVRGLTVTQAGQLNTVAYVVDGANHRIMAYEMR
ncbi:uncharacterized protein [Diadema antillarum]|uniref:uncharacterized protein n=1 Tax=Diadema antillarum TaxID=105358 RepID=UPI003A8549D1